MSLKAILSHILYGLDFFKLMSKLLHIALNMVFYYICVFKYYIYYILQYICMLFCEL